MSCRRGKIDSCDQTKVMKNYKYLKDNIDAKYLIDYFIQEEIFNLDDKDEICVEALRSDRNDAFLRRVCNSGKNGFRVFIEALYNAGYEDAVKKIQKTDGTFETVDDPIAEEEVQRKHLGTTMADVIDGLPSNTKNLVEETSDDIYDDAETPQIVAEIKEIPPGFLTLADIEPPHWKNDYMSEQLIKETNYIIQKPVLASNQTPPSEIPRTPAQCEERKKSRTKHTRETVTELETEPAFTNYSAEMDRDTGTRKTIPMANSVESILRQFKHIEPTSTAYEMNTPKFTADMYDACLRDTGVPWFGSLTDEKVDSLVDNNECIVWYNEENQLLYVTMTSDGVTVDSRVKAKQDDCGDWQFAVKGTTTYYSDPITLFEEGIANGMRGKRRKLKISNLHRNS